MNERNEDEHFELKIGIAYYLAGCFPAVPYEIVKRIADDAVEGMLRAVREAEREAQGESA